MHAATIFFSSFLLFLVQPLIAKQILPWFGGAASVWATCLVFFQSALLAGYAYAHSTTRLLAPRRQSALHLALLAASLLILPIVPGTRWQPGAESEPALLILGLLIATIGLPYFLLSTTSPLVQVWFWRSSGNPVPYRLFALSNLASLLALLSYPVLVEPFFSLALQAKAWSVAYAAFAALCAVTAWRSTSGSMRAAAPEQEPQSEPPPPSRALLWIVLAAAGSCLLLAVTSHLTQNLASIPFLWVVPLSIYLVTFILCFDHPRWYRRGAYLALVAVLTPAMAWYSDSLELRVAAPLYAAGLFVCCMFCHGELARLRPAPRFLTSFYLMISLGGALGALLVAIGAPKLLPGYYELGIVLTGCAALLFLRVRSGIRAPLLVLGSGLVVILTASLAVLNVRAHLDDTRISVRNFYGVVRTRDYPAPVPFRVMFHGAINHGGQFLDPAMEMRPASYFGATSGYGRTFASLDAGPRRVGVIGLGAGAIAAYARRGDVFRFYEIDPQVVQVAESEFTFLRKSPARTDVILGDGRLSLESEPDQHYDLLAVDAFSGDSIPMHLLTREAMATYVRHLDSEGAIVFQATNRFVDIAPVVARLAAEFGMTAVLVSDSPPATAHWTSRTRQIIVSANRELLEAEPIRSAAVGLRPDPSMRVWTDDFYNLLRILEW